MPVLLFIRGLSLVLVVVGLVLALHYYLGTRLFVGLPAPWSAVAWAALWFASGWGEGDDFGDAAEWDRDELGGVEGVAGHDDVGDANTSLIRVGVED